MDFVDLDAQLPRAPFRKLVTLFARYLTFQQGYQDERAALEAAGVTFEPLGPQYFEFDVFTLKLEYGELTEADWPYGDGPLPDYLGENEDEAAPRYFHFFAGSYPTWEEWKQDLTDNTPGLSVFDVGFINRLAGWGLSELWQVLAARNLLICFCADHRGRPPGSNP